MSGTGFVIDGTRYAIPGLDVTNYLDNPKCRLKMSGPEADGYVRGRGKWVVRNVCFHTTEGKRPVRAHNPDSQVRLLVPQPRRICRENGNWKEPWKYLEGYEVDSSKLVMDVIARSPFTLSLPIGHGA